GEQDASPDLSRGSRTEGRFEVLTSARCPTATVKAPPHLPERPHQDRHSREAVQQERTTLNPDDARQDLDLPVVGSKKWSRRRRAHRRHHVTDQRRADGKPSKHEVPLIERTGLNPLKLKSVATVNQGPQTA